MEDMTRLCVQTDVVVFKKASLSLIIAGTGYVRLGIAVTGTGVLGLTFRPIGAHVTLCWCVCWKLPHTLIT
jgi:hypothetical protein